MVTAVEHRFGRVNQVLQTIEWLSDNGSGYTAHETRRFARDIGLEPRNTPNRSPQSNGMAEAFVRTIKRDYIGVSPLKTPPPSCASCRCGSSTTTPFTHIGRSA